MLRGVELSSNLSALARAKSRDYETKSIQNSLLDQFIEEGWQIDRKNSSTTRIKRVKKHDIFLSDRVWMLMYRMGFKYLSENSGSNLVLNPKEIDSQEANIKVVGIDDEVAVAASCISFAERSTSPTIQQDIIDHSQLRERFANAINTQYNHNHKRQVVLTIFTANINLTDEDRIKATQSNIILFDENDLSYYENLVSHLGNAARFQFLADMLPGKKITGLTIKVPAIKTKMGGTNCYTFSISPEYLLKISYVSHRSKGKASDINTYQRMINKTRLNRIRQYIKEDGTFPTNIVLNIEKGHIQFDKIRQECDEITNLDIGILGWLILRPAYKSAWVIDGQHRLYAYSGLDRATNAHLAILAFEGLPPSKQAQLFVDINAKQKSVNMSLLQELYAELHWDADDPEVRIRAIISKAVQELNADPNSSLYKRIQSADKSKDTIRCITLSGIYGSLDKPGFHVTKSKNNSIEYGPLWAETNDLTLKRTVFILREWLNTVRSNTSDWWDKGSGDGGGLAMNDGIITCLNVLRSVFQSLSSSGIDLRNEKNENLLEIIRPFGQALGEYLGSLTEDERKRFRDLRGIQGQTTRTRRCQQAIREKIQTFDVPGLDEFISLEKAQTNIKAKVITDWIEKELQKTVIEELKREFGSNDSEWWICGVPKQVRTKVSQRFEEDDGKRGNKDYYFDLLDYKKIILDNWNIFEGIFAYKTGGNKEKKVAWIDFVSQKRNIVAHPTSSVTLSIEELDQLNEYKEWLEKKIDVIDDFEDTD